jgi:hypothetical protein
MIVFYVGRRGGSKEPLEVVEMLRFIFEVFRPNELRLCIFVEKKLLTELRIQDSEFNKQIQASEQNRKKSNSKKNYIKKRENMIFIFSS